MHDNFPVPLECGRRVRSDGSVASWTIDPLREVELQAIDATVFVREGGFRRWLGSPDAPIVCVRGNHDFVDLASLFEGCGPVHELIDDEVIEVLGLRVTGHRGIPRISGVWSDEVERDELRRKVDGLPVADLYLTHYPPAGVLDDEIQRGREVSFGLEGMLEALEARIPERSIHCFGHIHGRGGTMKERGAGSWIGGVGARRTFSNAACGWNEIEV